MYRGAVLIALVFAASCKKNPPPGDLPPAKEPPPATSSTTVPPANPHAGMPANPHAGMPANPHAGMPTNPQGPTAQATPPTSLEKLPDGRLAMGPFSLVAPADWTAKPVTSNMRAAQFELPGKPGAEAELVVTYFGKGGAGSIDDNIDRWVGQIRQPDGKPSRDVAKIEKTKFGGQDATYMAVSGRYVAPNMPGASESVDKRDQTMLAAIVESPSGPYYFKLVGMKTTVDANAAAFRAMLDSLKVR